MLEDLSFTFGISPELEDGSVMLGLLFQPPMLRSYALADSPFDGTI